MALADTPGEQGGISQSCSDSFEPWSGSDWESERDAFFLGSDWFDLLASHIVTAEQQVHVWAAGHSKGQLLLPTMTAAGADRQLMALSNYYSSLFAPVANGDDATRWVLLDKVLDNIDRATPRWQQLRLEPMEVDSEAFRHLADGLKRRGWWVQPYFCFGNWYLPSTGLDWEGYLAARPSKVRNTLKRKQKKFDKDPANRLVMYTGGEDLETAIAAYQAVYEKSWKQAEPYPHFIADLIRLCAGRGWLRLGVAWVGDTPIAAQLWVVAHGKAAIFKLAYDEAHKPLSAGTLLTALLMRHALDEDKVDEVDYLTGDDAYKRDWMSERRERWGLLACNPRTLQGLFAGLRHVGAARLKAWIRRGDSSQGHV